MTKKTIGKSSLRSRSKHLARKLVVPHKHNDYRPHLIRGHGIAVMVVLVLSMQWSYNFFQTGSVLGQSTDIRSSELLAATNQYRDSDGIGGLKLNDQLNQAAKLKVDDMFKQQYWAHTAPNGATPWQWFKESGYQYKNAGENLAKGFVSSNGVVAAWMNSSEHRANVLGAQYQDVGFAIKSGTLDGEKTTIVVAFYGAKQLIASKASAQIVLAANDQSKISPIARIGVGLQSMTPAALASGLLVLVFIIVALFAHAYRKKLPYGMRTTWMKHHALYKAVGMASFALVLVALYGGGQI